MAHQLTLQNLKANQGTDRIHDDSGQSDSIVLGSNYTFENVTFERVGQHDLALKSAEKTLILIEGQFNGSNAIETLVYGNGATTNLLAYSYTLNGTALADTLYGTAYGSGADKLNGFGGDDTIFAGMANDIVTGGDGNDSIYGDVGDDTLSGNAGDDYISAGAGNDTVIYESGLDRLLDGGGVDIISIANSAITAENLTLRRTVGNSSNLDILLNGTHAFTIQGQFNQDQGFETIKFTNGTTFNLTNVQYTSTGTSGNDYLYGISYGGNPNDIMNGGAGDDTLYGYEGNDTLDGGMGANRLNGGNGNDIYKVSLNEGADTITDGSGTDVVQFGAGFSKTNMTVQRDAYNLNILFGGVLVVTADGHFRQGGLMETLKFSDNSTYSLVSLSLALTGTENADTLLGHDAIDNIKGNGGNDQIWAYGGNDTLDGGSGYDYLYGGLGDDTYVFGAGFGFDNVSDDAGADTLKLGVGMTTENISVSDYGYYDTKIIATAGVNEIQISSQRYTEGINAIETLQFADGFKANLLTYNNWIWGSTSAQTTNGTTNADTVFGRGGNDTIIGNAGNDALHGGSGNDMVKGVDGNDLINGGIGNDTLYGDAGNDIIYGDDGLDKLYGGAGGDTFVFFKETAFKNIDIIYDFKKADLDKINIADLLQGYNPLTKVITDFVQISNSGANSIVKVDVDGGANNFVQVATINGVTGLTDEAALMKSGNLITA